MPLDASVLLDLDKLSRRDAHVIRSGSDRARSELESNPVCVYRSGVLFSYQSRPELRSRQEEQNHVIFDISNVNMK